MYSSNSNNNDKVAVTDGVKSNSTSLVLSNTVDSSDICISETSNNNYSKVSIKTNNNNNENNENSYDKDLEIIDTKPQQKNFLEKTTQIVPFNKDLANRLVLKEDLEKKFSSLYVLSFVQDDDVFEYFRSIVDYDYNTEMINKGKNEKSDDSNSKKIRTVKDCKYLYMIVENPKNRNESYELGLKVVDIVPTNSSNKY